MRFLHRIPALGLASALTLTLGCSDGEPVAPQLSPDEAAAAAADVWWEGGEVDYTFVQYVWCLDETLTWTGTYWYRYHFAVNRNRETWLFQFGVNDDFQAVGASSGIWRVDVSTLNGIMQTERWIAPLGEPFQVISLTNPRWTFVNEMTGEKFSFPFRLQFVRNAAGQIKVDTYVEPCRLR